MVLSPHSSYPQALTYVLKLHHEAVVTEGHLIGRLEHVATGNQFQFSSAAELISCLTADATRALSGSRESES